MRILGKIRFNTCPDQGAGFGCAAVAICILLAIVEGAARFANEDIAVVPVDLPLCGPVELGWLVPAGLALAALLLTALNSLRIGAALCYISAFFLTSLYGLAILHRNASAMPWHGYLGQVIVIGPHALDIFRGTAAAALFVCGAKLSTFGAGPRARLPGWRVLGGFLLAAAWLLLCAGVEQSVSIWQRGSPDPTLAVPAGLEALLWAASPQVYNPTALDIDERGRLWVLEASHYRQKTAAAGADRIVILEDKKLNGRCDSSKVFIEDADLVTPMGITVLWDRVYVLCSPQILVYTFDRKTDRVLKKEVLLDGFSGYDHDHGLHGSSLGPDGMLYFTVGNAGANSVRDASGWLLNTGWSDSPDGDARKGRILGVSGDGRKWFGGLTLRVELDGRGLRPVASNFRNSYKVSADSFGNIWQGDNDDDGSASCRIVRTIEGANYGYYSADAENVWREDRRPDQSVLASHWHADDPGVAPSAAFTGPGSPTGGAVYEGDLLPENFRGAFLICDAGRNAVMAFRPSKNGSREVVETQVLLKSESKGAENGDSGGPAADPAKWFRPSDIAVGPDGSVFVADWYDPVVGGHLTKDPHRSGRIFRIAPTNHRPKLTLIPAGSEAGDLSEIRSPSLSARFAAMRQFRLLGTNAIPLLRGLLSDPDVKMRARALWLLAPLKEGGSDLVREALTNQLPEIRLTAIRALRHARVDFMASMHGLARDGSAMVRAEAAVSLRDINTPETIDILAEIARRYTGGDRSYLEAWGIGCEGKEEQVAQALIATCPFADPLQWPIPYMETIWRLHPVEFVSAWAQRAASSNLSLQMRNQAVDALAFTASSDAYNELAKLANLTASPVSVRAAWWVKHAHHNQAVADREADAAAGAAGLDSGLLMALTGRVEDERAREKTIRRICQTVQGQAAFLAFVRAHPSKNDAILAACRELASTGDPSIRTLAAMTANSGLAAPKPPLGRPAQGALALAGNPNAGRDLFFGDSMACGKCHQMSGRGAKIGPDLTAIGLKYDRGALLDAILDPSAAISPEYILWEIESKTGGTQIGFMVKDAGEVVLKDGTGGEHVISHADILSRRRLSFSLMPAGLLDGQTEQAVADLLSFLLHPGE